MPKISVIVPVYKAEKYIEQCVNSILQQTFPDFELLLIDDGSPDQSGAICDRLAETDSRIRVIHKENGGVSSARNCGLDHATGEYIMFSDSDDYVAPDWCGGMLEVLERTDAGMCVCGYCKAYDGAAAKETVFSKKMVSSECCSLWEMLELDGNLVNSPCNKVFLRSVIEQHHLRFDTQMRDGEDQYFVLEYLLSGAHTISVYNASPYYYRLDNADSLTSNYVPAMWEQRKKCYELLKKTLQQTEDDYPSIEADFYGFCIDGLIRVLNNNMLDSSNETKTCRIRRNTRILQDPFAKEILQKGKCKTASKRYVSLLRLGNYYPVLLAQKVIR